MSILFFLTNPEYANHVTFDDGITQPPRTLLADAIDGWKLWMTVHYDHRFESLLLPLTGWLRSTSHKDDAVVASMVLRYLIEQLFQEFTTSVAQGGSQPRIAGCKPYSEEGAVAGFLTALETELLTLTVPRNPFPHLLVQRRMTTLDFATEHAHYSPRQITSFPPPQLTSLPSPPPASTLSSAPAAPAKICAWHAAHVLGVEGSHGPTPACRNGDRCHCPHVDPGGLHSADILEAARTQLRPNTSLEANIRSHLSQVRP
jgi:hypothetical protein